MQHEKDSSVITLYQTMLKTYHTAMKHDAFDEDEDLQDIFDAMIIQTAECALFIAGYAPGSYIGTLMRDPHTAILTLIVQGD